MLALIQYLREKGVLEFINATTTVVVAIFALVQLLHVEMERRARLRSAFGAVWIEYWRVWTASADWQSADLVALSKAELLDVEEILPRDWGTLLQLYGQLGMQSSRLAGMAAALARAAANHARNISRLQRESVAALEAGVSAQRRAQIEAALETRTRESEKQAKEHASRAADLYEDALRSAPRWLQIEKVDLSDLESADAKRIKIAFEEWASKRSRWTRLRHWIGGRLQAIARRVSPRLPGHT